MEKRLFILLMVIGLTGCSGKMFSSDNIFAPAPARMGYPDTTAPTEYLEGWRDGCETGLSTMNQGYYKSFYAYKLDANLINDPKYYKAWKDSYTYCRQYSFRYSWDSFDRRRNQGLLSAPSPLCILCPTEQR